MTMGEKILNMRKARGWSQEELAEKVGVTRQAVSRWESDSAKPDAERIVSICDLFGISADYLLREQYEGEAGPGRGEAAQVSELTRFFRSLTLKQWGYIGALLSGGMIYLLLVILSQSKGYRVGTFVEIYDLELLWLLACAGIAAGVLGLVIRPFFLWIHRETVGEV